MTQTKGAGQFLTSKCEIKMNIEAHTRCGGACAGCILTRDERTYGNVWDDPMFETAATWLSRFIADHDSRSHVTEYALNLGHGDYLLLDEAKIGRIVNFIHEAGQGKAAAFFTASAVSAKDRVAKAVETWHECAIRLNQPLLVDVVFDPERFGLDRFRNIYTSNIAMIRDGIGELDLNLNLGAGTIDAISPRGLDEFVRENGFRILTVNVTPTIASAPDFVASKERIVDWLIELVETWKYGTYHLNMLGPLAKAMAMKDTIPDADIESTRNIMLDGMSKSVYIDFHGNVFFVQAGIGDVPLCDRNGFQPLGRLADHDEDSPVNAVQRKASATIARIHGMLLRQPCMHCGHRVVCMNTGGAALAATIGKNTTGSECPTGFRRLYDAVERLILQSDRDISCETNDCYLPFVAHDFPGETHGRFSRLSKPSTSGRRAATN